MRRRSGFTFFEIMIVVVIMSVLLGIVVPKLKGTFGRTRLTAAARDVTALIRLARDMAVLTERQGEVRFEPEKSQYQLVMFDEAGERIEVNTRRRSRRWDDASNPLLVSAEQLNVQTLPNHVKFTRIYSAAEPTDRKDRPRIIFYPDGSATPATIAIQDDDQRTIRVEIYRTTGMTRVEPGLPPEVPKTQRLYYGPGAP